MAKCWILLPDDTTNKDGMILLRHSESKWQTVGHLFWTIHCPSSPHFAWFCMTWCNLLYGRNSWNSRNVTYFPQEKCTTYHQCDVQNLLPILGWKCWHILLNPQISVCVITLQECQFVSTYAIKKTVTVPLYHLMTGDIMLWLVVCLACNYGKWCDINVIVLWILQISLALLDWWMK